MIALKRRAGICALFHPPYGMVPGFVACAGSGYGAGRTRAASRAADPFPMPGGHGPLSPKSRLSIYNHFSGSPPLEQALPREIGFGPYLGIL